MLNNVKRRDGHGLSEVSAGPADSTGVYSATDAGCGKRGKSVYQLS